MKITKEHINTGLKVFAIVMITMQVSNWFKKKSVDEALIRSQIKIESLEERRVHDSLFGVAIIALNDSLLSMLKSEKTVFVNQYIQSNEKLKTIAPGINSLDDNDVISAAKKAAASN